MQNNFSIGDFVYINNKYDNYNHIYKIISIPANIDNPRSLFKLQQIFSYSIDFFDIFYSSEKYTNTLDLNIIKKRQFKYIHHARIRQDVNERTNTFDF